jgi:hypothetical protein
LAAVGRSQFATAKICSLAAHGKAMQVGTLWYQRDRIADPWDWRLHPLCKNSDVRVSL